MDDYLKIFTNTLDTEFEVRFGTQQQNITKKISPLWSALYSK